MDNNIYYNYNDNTCHKNVELEKNSPQIMSK